MKGRRGPTRVPALLVLPISALILATTPIWWAWGRSSANVGSLARLGGSTSASQRSTRPPQTRDHARPGARGLLRFRVRSGLLARFRQGPAPVPPVRLRVPAIGIDAPVVPVGVHTGTGAMDIPVDVSVVGWYRYSAQPGRAGSSVVIGHVDSRVQGAGAFFRLREVTPGAAVVVLLADGTVHRFTVIARREYRKEALPPSIFARSGRPLLALVTCGGPFDQVTRHYLDNVVVFALPARTDGRVA